MVSSLSSAGMQSQGGVWGSVDLEVIRVCLPASYMFGTAMDPCSVIAVTMW